MKETMTSLERVLAALGHREADRVPLFLLTSLQGARETGLPIRDYYSKSANVIEGQRRLREKYGGDCLYAFFHAALEAEAWGAEVLYAEDGPPNAGAPPIRGIGAIAGLEVPRVADSPGLQRVLATIRGLKDISKGEIPIMAVVMSPFSLPVMQLGFDVYLDLLHGDAGLTERLLRLNEDFCVEWANAQFEAGATAMCYFDPVSSPTIVEDALYRRWGQRVAKRAIARFKGPAAVHFASGRCRGIIDGVADSGALAIGVSASEDLRSLKAATRGKLALVGNLNAVEMRRWTPAEAEVQVKRAIAAAGPGGGFILSDNHGEIPWQVPDEILLAISEAARKWGSYPLGWLDGADA